ncbi:uncharacterized protein BDZ99DRAFT_459681 [Mytilinidion resinicola]|uniref:Uncharacterized protein n=1 Tax=Mytilinidion resinicola TaxID=574789 RepID=A0A6A6YYD2_9PEZI|nr:uncharacterized protein BDZ99DRAFT_459681 [Mytilinidion resinicola]KAF2813932.1 hypothetical protein BDZ99DRAFT_459681 [Mytilinidion resinicola]
MSVSVKSSYLLPAQTCLHKTLALDLFMNLQCPQCYHLHSVTYAMLARCSSISLQLKPALPPSPPHQYNLGSSCMSPSPQGGLASGQVLCT